jgi:hypothetical protein
MFVEKTEMLFPTLRVERFSGQSNQRCFHAVTSRNSITVGPCSSVHLLHAVYKGAQNIDIHEMKI